MADSAEAHAAVAAVAPAVADSVAVHAAQVAAVLAEVHAVAVDFTAEVTEVEVSMADIIPHHQDIITTVDIAVATTEDMVEDLAVTSLQH